MKLILQKPMDMDIKNDFTNLILVLEIISLAFIRSKSGLKYFPIINMIFLFSFCWYCTTAEYGFYINGISLLYDLCFIFSLFVIYRIERLYITDNI